MIEGGWEFVIAAYAVALSALGALTGIVLWRARHWDEQARALKPEKDA